MVPAHLIFASVARADLASLSKDEVFAKPVDEIEREYLALPSERCADALENWNIRGEVDPANLTPAQMCVVQNYTGATFEPINKGLWTVDKDPGALNGVHWAYVRILDAALAKMPNFALTVYSGTSPRIEFETEGEEKTFKAYTSSSDQESGAMSLEKGRMLVIKIKSGKNFLTYSGDPSESEILIARDTKFRFEKRKMKTVKSWSESGPIRKKVEYIYLTEVP